MTHKSWEVPKKYKGNTNQMGFIHEYLIFETVKQYIAKKDKFSFQPIVRTTTGDGSIETNYFVNDQDNPSHLLCQGLNLIDTKKIQIGLQNISRAHDVTYLVKKNAWNVKAIFEVKGFFEYPSLKIDIDRLIFAEENYPMADNYSVVFVGFKSLTSKEKELIRSFTKEKNHFCVLPGKKESYIGDVSFEEVLDLLIS